MGTGAKIAIVLGLLLIVIGFVRYLDDDISDGMSKDGDPNASLANGPEDSSPGFRELGQADPESGGAADSYEESTPSPTETPVSPNPTETPDDSRVAIDPVGDEESSLRNAALRPVRPEDRENGFVGPVQPLGDSTESDEDTVSREANELLADMESDLGATTGDESTSTSVAASEGDDRASDDSSSLSDLMNGELDRPRMGDRPIAGGTTEPGRFDWGKVRPIDYDEERDGAGETTHAALGGSDTRDGGSLTRNLPDRPEENPVRPDPAPVSETPVTAPPVAASGFPKEHKVVANDRVWDLAGEYYGRPALFRLILEANPSIGDGSRLKIGQTLTIPAPPAATTRAIPQPPTTASTGTYVVKKGDRLYNIAERLLGSGPRWREIARANPAIDPDRLQVGAELVIPPK